VNSGKGATVLCLNAGSSSLKLAMFEMGEGGEVQLSKDAVERIGLEGAPRDHGEALALALGRMGDLESRIDVVGHRVVHGGRDHVAPVRVDADLVASLRALVPLAPLHLPAAIAGIDAVTARNASVVQVACFDTAFHSTLSEVAWHLPLPARFADHEVRRYGFHGLSYEYVLSTLAPPFPERIVIAHLGNGASLAAIHNGRSVDTTMGLTPTGGIPMGTRTGDLDPGVLLYLLQNKGIAPAELEQLVDRQSGLLGIGGDPDMQTLLQRRSADPRAALAVTIFGYSVRKAIGAMTAALGGLDLLVFTGGIGEHAAEVRAESCKGLEVLGVALDPERNARGERVIGSETSRVCVRIVCTDEDLVIARHARRIFATVAEAGTPVLGAAAP
jgi:acetate kinase